MNYSKDKIDTLYGEEYLKIVMNRIKELRENTPDKITQEMMAELLGTNRARINRIENGHYPMTIQELVVYATLLEKTPTQLLETKDIKWHKKRNPKNE